MLSKVTWKTTFLQDLNNFIFFRTLKASVDWSLPDKRPFHNNLLFILVVICDLIGFLDMSWDVHLTSYGVLAWMDCSQYGF